MEAKLQREMMLNTSIPKLISKLSIPTVLSQLITVIYNTADTYFVSQISTSASAAVGAVFSLQSVIQAIGFGIAMGSSSLISIKLGRKEEKEAHILASSAFFMAIILGTVISIFGLMFIKPIMILIGSTETMLEYSINYAKYILISAPLFCSSFVLNAILRSEGETKEAMTGITVGGCINLILDPIFIFKLNLGISGAAIATMLSQAISFSILLFMMIKKSIVKLKICYLSTRFNTYYKILANGIPTIARQGLGSVATALLNNQAKIYGDAAIAAISIVNKVYMLIRNIILGIGQGFQPVAGYNYGAKKYNRVKQAFLFSVFVGTCFCILFAILTYIFKYQIISFFRNDTEVINIGIKGLTFYVLAIPFLAFSTFTNQLYQSLAFKWKATLLASLRQGIFYIPLIFILPKYFCLNGILSVQSLSDILTFLVSIPFLIYFFKKYLYTK